MDGPEYDNMSTVKNKIFVPLDYAIEPKILPEFLPGAAEHEKYMLLDLRQQYLGLYEKGKLKHSLSNFFRNRNRRPLKNS